MGSWQVLVGGAQGCVGVLDCRPRALGAKLSQVLSNVADVLPDGGGGGRLGWGRKKRLCQPVSPWKKSRKLVRDFRGKSGGRCETRGQDQISGNFLQVHRRNECGLRGGRV